MRVFKTYDENRVFCLDIIFKNSIFIFTRQENKEIELQIVSVANAL